MVHGIARNLCRRRDAGTLAIADLDLHLRSRRTTDAELQPVIEIPDFCSRLPRYEAFLHNDWIQGRLSGSRPAASSAARIAAS